MFWWQQTLKNELLFLCYSLQHLALKQGLMGMSSQSNRLTLHVCFFFSSIKIIDQTELLLSVLHTFSLR